MNIVITNCWHDDNKGDCGIVLSIMETFSKIGPTTFTLVSEFSKEDIRFKDGYRHIINEYPDARIICSPIPIFPIFKHFSKDDIFSKLVFKLSKKRNHKLQKAIINSCLNVLKDTCCKSIDFNGYKDNVCSELLKVVADADIVISKGGSFVFSDGTISGALRLARVLFPLYLASSLNKKVIFFPQSFYALDDHLSKSIVCPVLKRSSVFSRERLSYHYLKENLKIENEFFPDIACFLSTKVINHPFLTKLDLLNKNGAILIGLTVRDWKFEDGKEGYIENINSIVEAVLTKYDKAYFVIVPQVTGPVSFENDLIIMDKIYRRVCKTVRNKIIVFKNDASPYLLKNIYSKFRTILGTRLHSLIFSFTVGVPGIALSYSANKTLGFYKELGLEELVFDINDIPVSKCVETIYYVLENRDSIINQYEQRMKEYDQALLKRMESIVLKDTQNYEPLSLNELEWTNEVKNVIESKYYDI